MARPSICAPNAGGDVRLYEWVRLTNGWLGQIARVVPTLGDVPTGPDDELMFDTDSRLPEGVVFVMVLLGEMVTGDGYRDTHTFPKTNGKVTWAGSHAEILLGPKGTCASRWLPAPPHHPPIRTRAPYTQASR